MKQLDDYTRNLKRPGWQWRYVMVLVAVFFTFTQVKSQVAPVEPPSGGFAIDGNLRAGTPTSPLPFAPNQGDWVIGTSGTGGYIFNVDAAGNASLVSNTLNAGLQRDPYNDGTDIIFTNGSKFRDNPNTWNWSASKPPSKNDINNSMYLVTRDADNNDWILIGGDRLSTNGTSYIDFELLQNTLTRNTSGNGFTSAGPDGGRTVNDMVVSMEYSNGGTQPIVRIYRWQAVGSGFDYVLTTTSNSIAFAETNRDGAVDVPFGAFGSNSYQQFSFVEAAINVTQFLRETGDPCTALSIKTIFIKTKASDSPTAALKDVVEPIQVSINFGSAQISYGGPYCPVGTATVTQTGVTGGTYSAPSGLSINSSTGEINLANSSAGNHTVTYTYVTNGCTKTATASVEIKSTPGAPTVGVVNNCNGTSTLTASNYTGTLLWSTGETTASITVNSAGAYTVTQTVNGCTSPAGTGNASPKTAPSAPGTSPVPYCVGDVASALTATGSNLKWYTVPTGGTALTEAPTPSTTTAGETTYYVSQTVDGCESPRASLVVTVNAKPSISSPAIGAICAGATSASLTHQGVTAEANQYKIIWNSGLTSMSDFAALPTPSSPITISGTSALAANTYTGTIYVKNSTTGCESEGAAISLTVNANPTASAGTAPSAQCYNALGNTFSLSGSGSNGTPLWTVKTKPTDWTVDITDDDTFSPSVKVTGTSGGGTVVLTLTVTSDASPTCGSDTDEVSLVVSEQPSGPDVTYNAPECYETTFSVTVNNPEVGAFYSIKNSIILETGVLHEETIEAIEGEPVVFMNRKPGTGYTVTATIGNCVSEESSCEMPSGLTSQSSSSLQSIEQPKADDQLTAYPIPFSERTTLEFKAERDGNYEINLYDMKGTLIRQLKSGTAKAGEITQIEVDGRSMADGMYLARMVSGSGAKTVKLLKKNR